MIIWSHTVRNCWDKPMPVWIWSCHLLWQEAQNLPEGALSVQTEEKLTAMKLFLFIRSASCFAATQLASYFCNCFLNANSFATRLTWLAQTVLHGCFSQPQLWLVKHPSEMKVEIQLFSQQSGTHLAAAGESEHFYLSSPTDVIITPTSRLCTLTFLISDWYFIPN